MKKLDRTKIHFSKKLDKAVRAFEKTSDYYAVKHDYIPFNHIDVPRQMFGEHDTNGAIETGFLLGLDLPPDEAVFSGYVGSMRYYVRAKSEADALSRFKKAVKKAVSDAKAGGEE